MNDGKRGLLTGGAGYIGSHSCRAFSDAGYKVSLLDNFCNSSPVVLERLEQILGYRPELHEADIRDEQAVQGVLKVTRHDAVVDMAGLQAVDASVEQPCQY